MSASEESTQSGPQEPVFVIPRPVRSDVEVRARPYESPLSMRSAIGGDRRVESVLAVMRGELSRAEGARAAGVSEGTIMHDQMVFIKGGREALQGRGRKSAASATRDVCNDRALHALGAMTLERYEARGSATKREGA